MAFSGGVTRQKTLQKNTKTHLAFAKKHLNEDLRENIMWTDETKVSETFLLWLTFSNIKICLVI